MHRKGNDGIRLDFFFKLKNLSFLPKNFEPEKCQELKWFNIYKLPRNMVAYIKEATKLINKGIIYSNFGW